MTDHYALIGNPISHSRSPAVYAAFAQQCAQDIAYHTILSTPDHFAATVHEFQRKGGKGVNITMPFKRLATGLADQMTARAHASGALNMLTFDERGTVLGDNTDGVGLVRDIKHRLGRTIAGQSILLLGAGGAIRGVLLSVLAEHPAKIFIANRTVSTANELVRLAAPKAGKTHLVSGGFSDITTMHTQFDIVIHGAASQTMDDLTALLSTVWNAHTLAYDLRYDQSPTAFVLAAKKSGVEQAVDGIGMLVTQAALCFSLWRGIDPDIQTVIRALSKD